jgi:hypothetical protein
MRIRLLIVFIALWAAPDLVRGQVRINEIMAFNSTGISNPLTGEPGDWIELYNTTSTTLQLDGYFLSDNPEATEMWRFPQGTSLPSGGYLIVWADEAPAGTEGLHASFRLNVSGETLLLHTASGTLVDWISLPRMYENVSYGISSGGEKLYFSGPTPGGSNNEASGYRVAGHVLFDPPAGVYPDPVSVTLLSTEIGGTIRYTLDGSEPGVSDPLYSGPLQVSTSTVIRARQWVADAQPGEPSTSSYIIHEGYTFPVISLASDPAGLWSDQTGIYVAGTNGITGYCSDQPVNWNQEWERPVSMEYIDTQGVRQLQADMGLKIHGGCSRTNPQKSLGLFARSEYGTSTLEYRFFQEKEADRYNGLILRNAGNDYWYSYIRDAVIQASVSTRMDIDHQAYEPVQVFINGEYWGIHNLREKVNEHWVTTNYGIPQENLDFIKNFYEVYAGSSNAFIELTNFLETHTLASETNYNYVAQRIDIPSYQDYLITQFFFANRDWPGNNQKYWRDRVRGSKWRWILFDMEFSMGLYEFNPAIDMFSFATADDVYEWPNPVWATLMIRRMLENQGFRDEFIRKFMMHLNTTLATDRVVGVIDSLYYRLYDAFPAHIERWHQVGSMAEWEVRVDELRRFATERPGYVWSTMRNFFSLGPLVQFNVEPTENKGLVIVNGISVPAGGMSGNYLSGTGMEAEFQAAPGYRFDHWEVATFDYDEVLLLPRNSQWRYLDQGLLPGAGWTAASYNDSGWPQGPGELGYGDNNESTPIEFGPDEQNKPITYYFRSQFEIDDTARYDSYFLRLLRDDGAVVYINGTEAQRDNLPTGTIGPETLALTYVGDADESYYYEFTLDRKLFRPGTNVVAVEIHQNSPTSSDISFDLEIEARGTSSANTLEYEDLPLLLVPEGSVTLRAVTVTDQGEPDLHINEIMASNQGALYDEFGNDGDWIEVYNAEETPVDMAGIFFTDNLAQPAKWMIPAGYPDETTVPAQGFLVFFADGNTQLGPLHLDFKLDAGGDDIGLSYPSGTGTVWIDSAHFGQQITNVSNGRYPDGEPGWIAMGQYTPGESNVETSVVGFDPAIMEISLYPNPATEFLTISGTCPSDIQDFDVTIHLVDLTGRRLLEKYASTRGGGFNENLDVSHLPEGVYLLVVETPKGTRSLRFMRSYR